MVRSHFYLYMTAGSGFPGALKIPGLQPVYLVLFVDVVASGLATYYDGRVEPNWYYP